jgi:hypothetical protein
MTGHQFQNRRIQMGRTANDDRSDSMNPNNDDYYSSRGVNRDDDADDDFQANSNTSYSHVAISPKKTCTQIYGFGAASIEGRAMYGYVKFVALDSGMRDITSRLEDFLEFIEQTMSNFLRKRLQTKTLALYAVFDPTKSCLPWHVPLDLDDMQRTRDSLTITRCAFVADTLKPKSTMSTNNHALLQALSPDRGLSAERRLADKNAEKVDPDPYLKALRNEIILPEDTKVWAEFPVPYSGKPDLTEASKLVTYFNRL